LDAPGAEDDDVASGNVNDCSPLPSERRRRCEAGPATGSLDRASNKCVGSILGTHRRGRYEEDEKTTVEETGHTLFASGWNLKQ
jgi:hypothetical protein